MSLFDLFARKPVTRRPLDMIALNGAFVRSTAPGEFHRVAKKADAHGVMFLCPKCFVANGGSRGTHMVICWSRSAGADEELDPGPGRWKMDGEGLHDLTLNADPPGTTRSVQLNQGCKWHGFITNGVAA